MDRPQRTLADFWNTRRDGSPSEDDDSSRAGGNQDHNRKKNNGRQDIQRQQGRVKFDLEGNAVSKDAIRGTVNPLAMQIKEERNESFKLRYPHVAIDGSNAIERQSIPPPQRYGQEVSSIRMDGRSEASGNNFFDVYSRKYPQQQVRGQPNPSRHQPDMFSTLPLKASLEFPNPMTDVEKIRFYKNDDGLQSPR